MISPTLVLIGRCRECGLVAELGSRRRCSICASAFPRYGVASALNAAIELGGLLVLFAAMLGVALLARCAP